MTKYSQKSLEYKINKVILDRALVEKGDKVVVAVSGGVDSRVLLDLLLKLKSNLGIELKICHFNHKMRGVDSDKDEKFVRSLSNELGLEFLGGKNHGKPLRGEEEAREARYRFFDEILDSGRGDKLAIAHTADDVAETFLFRLIRGTGRSGLSSIPFRRKNYIRPLLETTRQDVETYSNLEGLTYVTDRTNFDITYSRNFLRLKVFPLLKQLNPSIITTLSNSARMFEEESRLTRELMEMHFDEVSLEVRVDTVILSRERMLNFPPALRKILLRIAIQKISDLKDLTQKQIDEVCNVIEKGEGNKHKILPHSLRVSLLSGRIIISTNKKRLIDRYVRS